MSGDEVVARPAERRPGAQRLAAWLAVVSALVTFGVVVVRGVPIGRGATVPPLWQALAPLVTGVAVPAVGAWLTTRRDPLHGRVGLAVVVTWGLLTLPRVLAGVARLLISSMGMPLSLAWLFAAAEILAVVALVAAVVAFRGRVSPTRVHAPGARGLAAVGLVVWGLATTAAALLPVMSMPGQAGAHHPLDWAEWAVMTAGSPAATLLVLVAIAVTVWQRDSLLVASAVFVAAVHQVVPALVEAVSTLRFGERHLFGSHLPGPITVAGFDVAVLVPVITIVGAAVLVTATGPLAAAARRGGFSSRRGRAMPSDS